MYSESVRPVRLLASFAIILIFLTSCGEIRQDSVEVREARLAEAVELGYIAAIDSTFTGDTHRNVYAAEIRNIVISQDHMASIMYQNSYFLSFPMEIIRANEANIYAGRRVRAGDLLIEFGHEDFERQQIRLRGARQALGRFDRDFTWERAVKQVEIELLRREMETANEAAWQILALTLMRHEAAYELFLVESEITRSTINREINEIYELLEGERVLAPIDGIIIRPHGFGWDLGEYSWFNLVDESSLFFSSWHSISPDHTPERENERLALAAFRYGDILQAEIRIIGGGNYNFYVQVVNDSIVLREQFDRELLSFMGQYMSPVYILAPVDRAAFDALIAEYTDNINDIHFTMTVRTNKTIVNALTVPASAVGSADWRSYVYLYEDGYHRRQYVTVGVRHGQHVQILSGLVEGQLVMIR